MFKKNIVPNGEIQIKKDNTTQDLPTIMNLLLLLKALSEETGVLPKSYQNAQKTNIRVQFVGSCVDIEDFLEVYGTLIGKINEECPTVINGLVNEMEEGTIELDGHKEGYSFIKQSSSGGDFKTLSHIYLKVNFSDADLCDFAHTAAGNLCLDQNFVAMPRAFDGCEFAKGIFEISDVLYFRYLPVSLDAADVYEEMPEILSVEQASELWVRFLQGGASWAEFETVQNLVARGGYDGLYKWELALKLAVEKAGITISLDKNSVCAIKQNGERVNIAYNSSTGAEKLFAKIIFPA